MTDIAQVIGARHRVRTIGPEFHTLVKTYMGNPFDQYVSVASQETEEIWDVVTENYRQKIREGAIINNPCTYERSSTEQSNGSYIAKKIPSGETYETQGGCITAYHRNMHGLGDITPPNVHPDAVEYMQSVAKQRAIANIDSTPYAFAEDAGEIRETLKFLRRPFSSLLKLGRTFEKDVMRKSRRKAKRRFLSRKQELKLLYNDTAYRAELLASTWNEYRFAVSPLIRSAMDGLEAATFYNVNPAQVRRTARGFQIQSDSAQDSVNKYFNAYIYDVFNRNATSEVSVSAGILYTVTNPVENLNWRLGLRLKDIPTTTWELLPYSFMVDRVYDIKSTVSGVVNLLDPKVKVLAGWVTTKSEIEQKVSFISQTNPTWDVTVRPDVDITREFSYNRQTWNPSMVDTLPSVNSRGLVDTAVKTVDLIALTLSAFSLGRLK
jgi:hypothetical protein